MKPRVATLLAGLSLLAPLPFFVFSSFFSHAGIGDPPIFYPIPAVVLIGMFLRLGFATVCVPAIGFFLWNPRLLEGTDAIPKRSYVLLAVATVADAVWLAEGWKDGLGFQGATYTYSVCAINFAWIALLWLGFGSSSKARPSFSRNLLLHWMLFAWLAWSAFPFFGEML